MSRKPAWAAALGAVPWYDWLLAAVSLGSCAYVFARFPTLTAMSGQVTLETLPLSILLTVLTVEATRRTIGWSLVIILLALGGYVMVGHLVTGQLTTRNVGAGRVARSTSTWTTTACSGIILQITVIVIVPFVLMGQLLMRSGGSGFFNDLAIALMGRYRGGPAKMAVVGSSLFGMISGVAAANTVAVGVVTIPLMKRSGMPAKLAAAVEACASNGGQLMPPVMGAVAFVMADFLQIPYKEVAIAAILPSVMYYAALFIQADLESARYGYGKVEADKIPRLGHRAARRLAVPRALRGAGLHDVLAQPRARIRGDGGEPSPSSCSASPSATPASRMKLRRPVACGRRIPPPGCARSW